MGRTGRKHDGRVVVLACLGSELKGYMRKQANSRSINKHMQNGGMNSFNFHSSPRMIPHIFKPEVQFVKLSIEQFVPRGKKLKDDHAVETPSFREKLTIEETDLIAKYFHPASESTWRASLIAFPNFQAFPSKVCKVMHSCRTEMLIDSMQYLQGLTFPGGSGNFFVEDEVPSGDCFGVGIVEKQDNCSKVLDNSPGTNAQLGIADSAESPMRTLRTMEKHSSLDSGFASLQAHSYLFGSDFVSVDAFGKVLIISVPSLYFEDVMHSNYVSPTIKELQSSLEQDTNHVKTSDGIMQTEAVPNTTAYQTKSIKVDTVSIPRFCEIDSEKEKMLDGAEKIPETPGGTCETPDIENVKASTPPADEHCSDLRDTELSPRLTNLIKVGVVPESPLTDSGLLKQNIRNGSLIPDLESPPNLCTEMLLRSSSPVENERGDLDNSPCGRKVLVMKDDVTPLVKTSPVSSTKCSSAPLVVETRTPSTHFTNSSGSKSWHLSSGEKVETVEHERKFKRLRKVGDCGKGRSSKRKNENSFVSVANLPKSFSDASPIRTKPGRGKKKPETDVRTFIDEEAEVSTEADISSGEDDDSESYDDSFIDDRINPTAGCTQSESSRVDMMGIYRRSLLSQSPMVRQPTSAFSPECVASTSKDNGSGCSLVKTFDSHQVPQPECINHPARRKNTESFQIEERISSDSMPRITNDFAIENKCTQSRKRKLSFFQLESVLAINLEQEFSFQSDLGGKESSKASQQPQVDKTTANKEFDDYDDDDDDQFYASLDLDAMEAQATLLLKNKSESSLEKQPNLQNGGLQGSPSFDLGIW